MIDWGRIEELRSEVGDEDFAEIAELFLGEIAEAVEELPALTDPAARSDALHGMKGSAMNLGFTTLAQLCAQGEKAPDSVDLPKLSDLLGQSVVAMRARYPTLG